MKKLKFAIFAILMMIGFIYSGELNVLYLDNFESSYYATILEFDDLESHNLNKDVVNDLKTAEEKHNVGFFFVEHILESNNENRIYIYASEKAKETLAHKGIIEKNYQSFFVGKTSVEYFKVEECDTFERFDRCYLTEEKNDINKMRAFKKDLIKKYNGDYPKVYGSEAETWINLFSVWGIIFVLCIGLIAYDVMYQRKEITLRAILGENVYRIVANKIILESIIFSLIFIEFFNQT